MKPERSISGREGRSLVRKLVAGLRNAGLKPGDCVVVASFNDVSTSVLRGNCADKSSCTTQSSSLAL